MCGMSDTPSQLTPGNIQDIWRVRYMCLLQVGRQAGADAMHHTSSLVLTACLPRCTLCSFRSQPCSLCCCGAIAQLRIMHQATVNDAYAPHGY